MSMPNIPSVIPEIKIERDQTINLLLASIAFEELGQAHIINSEAEKIQYVLGTLEGSKPLLPPTIEQVLSINKSVESMMRSVIKNQMLLQFKLEDTIALAGNKINIPVVNVPSIDVPVVNVPVVNVPSVNIPLVDIKI